MKPIGLPILSARQCGIAPRCAALSADTKMLWASGPVGFSKKLVRTLSVQRTQRLAPPSDASPDGILALHPRRAETPPCALFAWGLEVNRFGTSAMREIVHRSWYLSAAPPASGMLCTPSAPRTPIRYRRAGTDSEASSGQRLVFSISTLTSPALTTCSRFHAPCTYPPRRCTNGVLIGDASHSLSPEVHITPAKHRFSDVGDAGFEPAASSL